MCGIEAAAIALRDQPAGLTNDDIDALVDAIASEARRLQSLLSPQRRPDTAVDLTDAIRPAIVMMRSLDVTVHASVGGPVWVHGNRDDLAQAVLAVLHNARIHAAGALVEVEVASSGHCAILTVNDRGPGLGKVDVESLFARGARRPDSAGCGLGLSIARDLVQRNGGELTAANRPGGGASFTFRLRCAASNLATSVEPALQPALAS